MILAGCGAPTADTSDRAAFEASLERMRASVPEDDLERFNDAVSTLMFASFSADDEEANGFAVLAEMAAAAEDPNAMLERAAPYLDGKTADEIMLEADRRVLARLERQSAALLDTIAANEAELAEALEQQAQEAALDAAEEARIAEAREIVAQIEIDHARYYWDEDRWQQRALIALRITNGTPHAIRAVYVDGILETPGRSVPWVEASFNYEFPGGLEPGEQQSLNLRPNQFGDWGNRELQDRDDLVLTLTATDFRGANNERFVGTNARDDYMIRSLANRLDQSVARLQQRLEEDQHRASELAEEIAEIRSRLPA